jgi:hypothetical protein
VGFTLTSSIELRLRLVGGGSLGLTLASSIEPRLRLSGGCEVGCVGLTLASSIELRLRLVRRAVTSICADDLELPIIFDAAEASNDGATFSEERVLLGRFLEELTALGAESPNRSFDELLMLDEESPNRSIDDLLMLDEESPNRSKDGFSILLDDACPMLA